MPKCYFYIVTTFNWSILYKRNKVPDLTNRRNLYRTLTIQKYVRKEKMHYISFIIIQQQTTNMRIYAFVFFFFVKM